jgi:hypothetical protein
MTDDLSRRLTAVADEMPPTDLTDLRNRVGRRSRHLGARRAVVTTVAAFAAVAGLVGGAVALASPDHRPTPAVPTVSDSPTEAPVPSPAKLTGTLTFLDVRAGRPITVTRVVEGKAHRTTFGVATGADRWVAAPSPDGTKVAIIRSADPNNVAAGDLQVITPGGTRKTLAHHVPWGGGLWPAWTPDGTAIIVDTARYDATTGAKSKATALKDAAGYLVWSPDGTHQAYAVLTSGSIAISRADGTDRRLVSIDGLPGCDEAGCPDSVQAVSDDGRYVALGQHGTDPTHQETTLLVYDTRDRREVALPTAVADPRVFFRSGGGMLIHTKKDYLLVDPSGAVAAPLHLPAGVTGDLVTYSG